MLVPGVPAVVDLRSDLVLQLQGVRVGLPGLSRLH